MADVRFMADARRRLYRSIRDCRRLQRSLWNAIRMHPTWFILAFLALFACATLSALWVASPSFNHQHRFHASNDCLECSDNVISDTVATIEDHTWFAFLKKPSLGVLFTFILALITVSGFLVAITKLEQLLGQVTSLRAFLEQATEIIQNAIEHNDQLWIVCHSPFIGNLSLRGNKPQLAFRGALERAATRSEIGLELIGLSPDRLRQYYERFATDDRYDSAEVANDFTELQEIFLTLRGKGTKNAYYCVEEEPAFFLVASEYEAVVASALFVPSRQTEDSKEAVSTKKVELIGFATRAGSTIESMFEAFQFTRRNTRQLEDAQEILTAIKSWAGTRVSTPAT